MSSVAWIWDQHEHGRIFLNPNSWINVDDHLSAILMGDSYRIYQ